MSKNHFPKQCLACLQRHQASCAHEHTSFLGGWHFSAGEVWDDINEVCDDCGANLDNLAVHVEPHPDNEELPI